jgi:hypothetical protein
MKGGEMARSGSDGDTTRSRGRELASAITRLLLTLSPQT